MKSDAPHPFCLGANGILVESWKVLSGQLQNTNMQNRQI